MWVVLSRRINPPSRPMHVISSIELSEITNVDMIPFKYLPVIPEILDTSCLKRLKLVAILLFIAID